MSDYSTTYSVYDGERLCGFFDRQRVELIGQGGCSPSSMASSGTGEFAELFRLPGGLYALVWSFFDDDCGGLNHSDRAFLLSKREALDWINTNGIQPPADLMTEMGLIDFNGPPAASGVDLPEAESEFLQAIREAGKAVQGPDLAAKIGKSAESTRQTASKLKRKGLVSHTHGHGYWLTTWGGPAPA